MRSNHASRWKKSVLSNVGAPVWKWTLARVVYNEQAGRALTEYFALEKHMSCGVCMRTCEPGVADPMSKRESQLQSVARVGQPGRLPRSTYPTGCLANRNGSALLAVALPWVYAPIVSDRQTTNVGADQRQVLVGKRRKGCRLGHRRRADVVRGKNRLSPANREEAGSSEKLRNANHGHSSCATRQAALAEPRSHQSLIWMFSYGENAIDHRLCDSFGRFSNFIYSNILFYTFIHDNYTSA